MKHAEWVRQGMIAGADFHVKKKIPWVHNTINAVTLAAWIGVFAALVWWGGSAPTALYLPVAGLLFGSLLFGLAILVIHECSHDMFFVAKDPAVTRRLNRIFGVLGSIPLFTDYVRHWEEGHRIHHLYPCEPQDPQDRTPLTGPELYSVYRRLLIPGYFLVLNPSKKYPGGAKRIALGALVWVPLVVGSGLYLSWQVPVAFVIAFQVTMMLNWTKKAQEHGSGLATEPDFYLRSRTYLYPLAFLCSPYNINYHFEHHLNFKVPWYSLPAYHLALRKIMPEALQPYFFHHEFFRQLAGKKPLPPAELRPLMEPPGKDRGPDDGVEELQMDGVAAQMA